MSCCSQGAGSGNGVGVRVGVFVDVNVAVRVGVRVGVAEPVTVAVGEMVGEPVRVGDAEAVRVDVALAVMVGVFVRVGVDDGVWVQVLVGVGPPEVTATPSSTAVQRTASLWLVRASPTKTPAVIEIVSEPTTVQFTPSGELDAVNVDPERTRRTQYGATTPAPGVCVVPPPVEARRWNARPFNGVSTIIACLDAAERVSRIITPPLAQASVFWMLPTRATMLPSPVSGW
jgi:hypothetical protein